MTAKEFVKNKYPKARSEKHKQNYGNIYWLIRNGNEFMYMADGETESKAWVKAKNKIIASDLK